MSNSTLERKAKGGSKKSPRKNPVIPEMVGIGRRVLAAREQKKLTQQDLADRIHTTTQDIGQVENGWRSMSVPRVFLFAKHLGVSAEWLLSGINPKVHAALVTNAKKFVKSLDALGAEGTDDPPA